ncbi:MAG: TlpA family protein disulfide reductase [Acidobacteria bacterium]|nr:TlpA family protein disulfide reductase [Acidobacteriota bacterium]
MNNEKTVTRIQAVAAVLLAGLCFVVGTSLIEPMVEVGDRAPRFSLTTDKGRKVSTTDFGGKVLVVNFWATWCPPCIEELPSLQAMADRLGPKGVVVLGVSVDRNDAAYRRFVQQAKIGFETWRDPEADISASYGTFKYPETYVIGSDGKVRQKHVGPRNWMEPSLIQSIESLL